MITKYRLYLLVLSITTINACSLAPGVPGLKTGYSQSSIPQKEGIDYKLVLINSDTIQNQKPFDYINYVRSKKKSNSIYKTELNKVINERKTSNGISKVDLYSKKLEKSKKSVVYNSTNKFPGITEQDNRNKYKYYIGKGDVLGITVWDHPELTDPSKNNAYGGHLVGSDGRIYFPYTGEVLAEGKTTESIRNQLASKLGSLITKPQVSVSIVKYRSQKIYTSGALLKPSTLTVDDTPTTVRDAISESGGLIPNQYTGYATLARNGKNISIDLNRMLKHNDNRQNFILKNGDRLNVVERSELDEFNRKLNLDVFKENTLSSVRLKNELKSLQALNPVKLEYELKKERSIARLRKDLERELSSEQAKVFVMGEVRTPGSVKYQVEDGMTLAEAINDAGSFKEETVNPKGIFVIRKEAVNDKIATVYQLPLSSVQSMFLAEQFNIRPRDILYVTATPSIRWNRLLAQLLPSLALYNATK